MSASIAPGLRHADPEELERFRDEIRDALGHLYDTAHLECHPLAARLLEPDVPRGLTRAQVLRGLLKETIEELRPQQGNPTAAPEWRSYLALYHRYVKGGSFADIEEELGLSRRQVQRELRQGIDALTAILWQRRLVSPVEADIVDETTEGSETQLVERELDRWPMERQPYSLQVLLDDTLWVLRPLLAERQVKLTVQIPPDVEQVFVDPTLIRQALVKVLRSLVQETAGDEIGIMASEADRSVDLILDIGEDSIDEDTDDWATAKLLIGRQGGHLHQTRDRERRDEQTHDPASSTRHPPAQDGSTGVILTLPLASRARVLVVDDVEAALKLYQRYLEPHNYDVVGATHGGEVLSLAHDLQPDAIILDVMMPGVDGWQVLRDLKSTAKVAKIPVIVCSVLDEPDLALSLGATAFVKKPVDRLRLLAILDQARGTPTGVPAANQSARS